MQLKRTVLPVLYLLFFTAGAPVLFAEKNPHLPPPFETPSTQRPAKVIGWPAGRIPSAPAGYAVELLAELPSPRSLYLLPNGDLLVSQAMKKPDDHGEKSPNRITLLRMNGSRLLRAETFAEGLHLPFGMAVWENYFYVAEPDRILRYEMRGRKLRGAPTVIAELPFPAPHRHWTRHLLLSPDGTQLFVSVGSASNVGEDGDPLDPRTAAILRMNLDGSQPAIFASGLRNPVSLAWEPVTGALWAAVNERDELGDGLVPDYITRVTKGGFYGWPYAYWGPNEDPRLAGQRPDLVAKTLVPDFAVGAHTAALGITFTTGTNVRSPFHEGALVAQHGSWNSSMLVGYQVLFVPFVNGQAEDGERPFLDGFIADEARGEVYGRPVATVVLKDGSVVVSDDGAGRLWVVRPEKLR